MAIVGKRKREGEWGGRGDRSTEATLLLSQEPGLRERPRLPDADRGGQPQPPQQQPHGAADEKAASQAEAAGAVLWQRPAGDAGGGGSMQLEGRTGYAFRGGRGRGIIAEETPAVGEPGAHACPPQKTR